MGGKGKAQTIGYRYFLGMHLGLAHGPIDAVKRLSVDDRVAWTGTNTGGQIQVAAEELFGGEKREGGVSGTIDVEMGRADQGQNSYLVGKLGSLIPAYRGIFGLVFRQAYLGNNPYLKKWSVRAQRIHVRQDGLEQWYDAKAAIRTSAETFEGTFGLSWYAANEVDGDDVRMGVAFFVDNVQVGATVWSPYFISTAWTLQSLSAVIPTGTDLIRIFMSFRRNSGSYNNGSIDSISATVNGASLSIINPGAETPPDFVSGASSVTGWTNVDLAEDLARRDVSPDPHTGEWKFDGGQGNELTVAYQDLFEGSFDMNAAHIIRECLTDPDWGMGYTDADIDDASFMEAADIFYDEEMGLSLLWDRQVSIEDFVQTVLRHVDAALYVSRTTGKFVLKAIRGGYDVGSLLQLDESNISVIEDPVRVSFGELTNSVTVKFWNASTGKDGSVTVTDTALVQQQGVVINSPVQYPGFSNSRNAGIAAQRDLRALSAPLLSCTVTADSDAQDLTIGDVFRLSWSKWGVSNLVMRVTGISYGTGRNKKVKISCTEDVFETNTTVLVVNTSGAWQDPSAPPSVVEEQLAAEIPYFELAQYLGQADVDNKLLTHPEIGYVFAAAGRPASAINATLKTDDGSGYEDAGTFDFCPFGYLASDITPSQTAFSIEDFEDLDEVNLGTHFQVGQELIRVDAIDPVTGAMTVGRGILDTVPQEHPQGAATLFWDTSAGFDPTEYVQGEEIALKVLPASGAGVLPESEASAMLVELAQRAARPYPPGNLQINAESYAQNAVYDGEVSITWAHRNRLEQTGGIFDDHTTGDIGPELGTLYRVQGYVNDVLVHTEDDIATTSAVWTPSGSGVCKVEVHSKRDGLFSMQGAFHSFTNSNLRITEIGDERFMEDGDIRFVED